MSNKKGFTIVELVIVIAVIAILAAVLIPTFSSVVSKANQSSALQTARSTLTNALNMSSSASLSGVKSTGAYQTMIVVDGHAFGYTGNELKAIDYPKATTPFLKGGAQSSNESSNTFNAIMIAAENLIGSDNKPVDLTTVTDGDEFSIKNVDDEIKVQTTENKTGCTNIASITKVYYLNGHFYLNGTYTAATSNTAATVTEYDAEVYINSDFSNKVVVFTTFAN